MPRVDLVVESPISRSSRVRQLEAMFDVPAAKKATLKWSGDLDFSVQPWHVGLVVGASGSGKSTLLRHLFGAPATQNWFAPSVIDDFAADKSIQDVADICQSVGFNTIPAWMRPFRVLSGGEQFRVELARRLLELPDPIVVDEFTSVVDRQVAQIGAHAVQKYIRKHGRTFVAASCHYDIVDWLQPDWILEPATMALTWRSLQRRPPLDVSIQRVEYEAWRLFAPFHYLTAELRNGARCFGLFVSDRLAAFAGMLHIPVSSGRNRGESIITCSRLVTLPDFQGLGLAMILLDRVGACYKAIKRRLRTYPAHPSLIRSFDKSLSWRLHKKPGSYQATSNSKSSAATFGQRPRPCAVFEFAGAAWPDRAEAQRIINGSSA